jgi:hypothetical protein
MAYLISISKSASIRLAAIYLFVSSLPIVCGCLIFGTSPIILDHFIPLFIYVVCTASVGIMIYSSGSFWKNIFLSSSSFNRRSQSAHIWPILTSIALFFLIFKTTLLVGKVNLADEPLLKQILSFADLFLVYALFCLSQTSVSSLVFTINLIIVLLSAFLPFLFLSSLTYTFLMFFIISSVLLAIRIRVASTSQTSNLSIVYPELFSELFSIFWYLLRALYMLRLSKRLLSIFLVLLLIGVPTLIYSNTKRANYYSSSSSGTFDAKAIILSDLSTFGIGVNKSLYSLELPFDLDQIVSVFAAYPAMAYASYLQTFDYHIHEREYSNGYRTFFSLYAPLAVLGSPWFQSSKNIELRQLDTEDSLLSPFQSATWRGALGYFIFDFGLPWAIFFFFFSWFLTLSMLPFLLSVICPSGPIFYSYLYCLYFTCFLSMAIPPFSSPLFVNIIILAAMQRLFYAISYR